MARLKTSLEKSREIRDVVRHLMKERGHQSAWIQRFIRQNYFIKDMWDVLRNVDEVPVDPESASIIYKIVITNKYFEI